MCGKRVTTLDPFNKAVNEYTRTVGNFMEQSIQALVLVPNLRSASNAAARKAVIGKAREVNIPENSVRLSVLNGMDACIAVRELHRIECLLSEDVKANDVGDSFRTSEQDEFVDTMCAWAVFCYPDQILPKTRASSAEFVGEFWLGEGCEVVI